MATEVTAETLAAGLAAAARQAGQDDPLVRRADWQTATVTAVNATPGTVDVGSIRARRLDTYTNPAIGDQIVITQSGKGNWLALGRIAATTEPIGAVLFKRKTADTGPRTSATPSADPHLSVTLAANATYTLDAFIRWSGDSASDMNWGWNTPSGAAGSWVCYADATSMTALPSTVRNIDTAINGGSRSYGAITTVCGHVMRGTVRTTTDGSLSANWASQTSGGTGVTVYADSWILLRRVE